MIYKNYWLAVLCYSENSLFVLRLTGQLLKLSFFSSTILFFRYCKLHLQRAGSYVIQSVVIVFIINSLLSSSESMTSCHLLSFVPLSAQLPLFCSLLISILMACTTYPHYIYSGKSTVLFLICVGYDAVQVTTGTLAIYSLALAFN